MMLSWLLVRLVLDTNVLLSALLTRGTTPDLLYQAWRKGVFDLVSSAAQIEEIVRALNYPLESHGFHVGLGALFLQKIIEG